MDEKERNNFIMYAIEKISWAIITGKHSEEDMDYIYKETFQYEDEVEQMNDQTETVVIPKEEYEQLQEESNMLACLELAGVDNWIGYDMAIRKFYGEDE